MSIKNTLRASKMCKKHIVDLNQWRTWQR